jgi:hypothetical protein
MLMTMQLLKPEVAQITVTTSRRSVSYSRSGAYTIVEGEKFYGGGRLDSYSFDDMA